MISGLTTESPFSQMTLQIGAADSIKRLQVKIMLKGPSFEGDAGIVIPLIKQMALPDYLVGQRRRCLIQENQVDIEPMAGVRCFSKEIQLKPKESPWPDVNFIHQNSDIQVA